MRWGLYIWDIYAPGWILFKVIVVTGNPVIDARIEEWLWICKIYVNFEDSAWESDLNLYWKWINGWYIGGGKGVIYILLFPIP